MSAEVEFESNAAAIIAKLAAQTYAFLEEAAAELESATIANTPTDTGELKGNWRHVVDTGDKTATVGNNTEYVIWVERGTGEYAVNGDGRKGGWNYQDAAGNWHFTMGTPPARMLETAWKEKIGGIMNVLLPAHLAKVGE